MTREEGGPAFPFSGVSERAGMCECPTAVPAYLQAGEVCRVRVRPGRLELPRVAPQDPKSAAYAGQVDSRLLI